jgi:2-dehydropantoate 2-reductase
MLKEGGVGAVYMEHVDSEVWYKLLLNLTTNAPCGIVRLRGGEAFENSEFYDMCKDIMQEAIDVAQKLGVDIDLDHLMGHVVPNAVKNAGQHYPSMAQDMMMKRARTEIDFLNGAIERLGKHVGVPTPVNTTIARLVRTIESNYDRQYYPSKN